MKKTKLIVLVNKKDKIIGFGEKYKTHKIPVNLHRAISILIFNKDKSQMLITRRVKTKPTWGGHWSNAVCTHPYPEETYQKAAERRLFEELGIKTFLKEEFNFIYEAEAKDGIWGECELDHVFTGIYEGDINPDPNEISEYKWIGMGELGKDVEENSNKYTPWFKMILNRLNV